MNDSYALISHYLDGVQWYISAGWQVLTIADCSDQMDLISTQWYSNHRSHSRGERTYISSRCTYKCYIIPYCYIFRFHNSQKINFPGESIDIDTKFVNISETQFDLTVLQNVAHFHFDIFPLKILTPTIVWGE